MVRAKKGKGKFYSFYRYFLLKLFHEGFAKQEPRGAEMDELLGRGPAASGIPVSGDLWLPNSWSTLVRQKLTQVAQGQGVKALAIAGEYGSGKTYVLRWLQNVELPARRIRPYYFDNPGVQFYDLANSLLRQVGRKDFAKCIWELAATHVGTYQRSLFSRGYEEYLTGYRGGRGRADSRRLARCH